MKKFNVLSCPQFSPQNAENRIEISNFSGEARPPTPLPSPTKKGLTVPCRYGRLFYSIETCWLLQFLLKPLLMLTIQLGMERSYIAGRACKDNLFTIHV